ncbi:glycosyltransferase family 2 protein [Pseudogemmobacter sp. W21_MBD1_M6]|uniref:glycosyltransferase family 2 protein n=1 Tax=Pseudogemmobacter sp. W21_MBD1_M6 TaxID=3240271 RepID=UPI003F9E4C15
MSITLSIVIPNYNGAAFLAACLRSVFAQITPACEVVLVDDGSTDHSADLVRHYFAGALEHGQLTLICTENAGPGAARNIGVQAASGDYIAFLDSDDFILPGYIARCMAVLQESEPDIVQFNLLRVLDDDLSGQHLIACHTSPDGLYELDRVRAEIFGKGKWFPVTRIFTRKIMLANPFPAQRVFYEDLLTLPFIFFQDLKIHLITEPLIAYRDNPHGTTRNHKPEHAYTMLTHFDRVSARPPSLPRDLMRVQVARSIVFLALELNIDEIDLGTLLRRVRGLENKAALAAHLGRVDQFFLRFPLLYTAMDWGRKRLRAKTSR